MKNSFISTIIILGYDHIFCVHLDFEFPIEEPDHFRVHRVLYRQQKSTLSETCYKN